MALYKSDNNTECDKFMEHEDILMKEKTLVLGLVTSMVASQIWKLMATTLPGLSVGLTPSSPPSWASHLLRMEVKESMWEILICSMGPVFSK
eukprot:TRINITY_DN18980_c0_g1_i1.p1 TRINITY_DN18980_c0_g1~~TRINITY_DN18980_c0_g1_i1.p1  ORF type:complete len:105 (-),score=37.09 TRINITY_DN18980_c0_g1_i1:303-578(-)